MSEQEKAGDASPPRASRHLDAPVGQRTPQLPIALRVLRAVAGIAVHDKIADEVEKHVGSEVECDHCGRKQNVNIKACLQTGWPKCCGETMKLNGSKLPNAGLTGTPRGGNRNE